MGLEGNVPARSGNDTVYRFRVPRAGGGTAPVPPVSPITRSNKGPPKGAFLLGQKGEGTRRERPALRQAKIPPVEGFLVPRAGGGTAPVPPGESLLLRQNHPHIFVGDFNLA